MPARTQTPTRPVLGNLRNPWRYPEFMEYGLAGAGFAQSAIAWSVFQELPTRRGLDWTLAINPQTWASIGLVLFALHLLGLWIPDRDRGYRVRLIASHLSCAFWTHFVGTTTLVAMVSAEDSLATLTSPALLAPYASFVVCVRLLKEWQ